MANQTGRLEQACDALAFILERILAVALIAGIALNFLNVVGRYLVGFTLTGVDEIEVFILIWIAFLGAAIVTWRRQHLRMDVLLNMCPDFVRTGVVIVEMCLLIVVASFAAVQSFRYVERIYALGAVSDIARVPTWIPHSAVFIGFGAIALITIIRTGKKLLGSTPVARVEPSESEPQS